jgi:cytidylate kinase
VICPDAEAKLFVTASAEVRAARRHAELWGRGSEASFEAVLADVKERDARDAGRAEAPMVAALDAVLIDTSSMSIDAAVTAAIAAVEAARK